MFAAHQDNTQTAGHRKGQGFFQSWALLMNRGTIRGDHHHGRVFEKLLERFEEVERHAIR